MSRLLDDIRRDGIAMPWFIRAEKRQEWTRHNQRLLQLIASPHMTVILADNVAQYYYTASGQENWDLEVHFPNLAPPFDVFWIEHKMPSMIHSDEVGDTPVDLPGARTGVLMIGARRENVKGEGIPDNVAWVLTMELFADYGVRGRGRIDGSPGSMFIALDAEGRIVDRPWMQHFGPVEANQLMQSYMAWLHPALLTISFMHCRNVTVVDNAAPPKLAKRYREKHGIAPVNWKTLIIEPLKQILRTEGRSDQVGVQKALHICRGHFKDYRQGKGLFGRYHQLVWHDSVVRGTKGTKPPAREIEVKV